jgi:hypothetical protein
MLQHLGGAAGGARSAAVAVALRVSHAVGLLSFRLNAGTGTLLRNLWALPEAGIWRPTDGDVIACLNDRYVMFPTSSCLDSSSSHGGSAIVAEIPCVGATLALSRQSQ